MREHARLHIDWTRCQARGACIELLAPTLVEDPDGFPLAPGRPPAERTNVPLDASEVAAARDAVKLCPRLALSLLPARPSSEATP